MKNPLEGPVFIRFLHEQNHIIGLFGFFPKAEQGCHIREGFSIRLRFMIPRSKGAGGARELLVPSCRGAYRLNPWCQAITIYAGHALACHASLDHPTD